MQLVMVDLCIIGSDRTTYTGDDGDKIDAQRKAHAAHENDTPFYVAIPISTIDLRIRHCVKKIAIEERSAREITHIKKAVTGETQEVRLTPDGYPAEDYSFDVTLQG